MDPSVVVTAVFSATVASAVVTAVLSHWNELSRAREERRQARLGMTYVEAIEMVLRVRQAIAQAYPRVIRPGEPDPPPMPTTEEQLPIHARLSAYGSPQMQKAYLTVQRDAWAFNFAVAKYDSLLVDALKSSAVDSADQLDQALKALSDVREKRVEPTVEAFLELANAELAERRFGPLSRLRSRISRPSGHPR